jgi:hypothetical protein
MTKSVDVVGRALVHEIIERIEGEAEPLKDGLAAIADQADEDSIAESVGATVRYAKLYDVQHWRTSTARYLDGTTYGFDPSTPPLTQAQFRELPSATYHAVVGAIAGGLAGERIAFECSAALCSFAPDDSARMFLATQVIDEARHVEVFTHRLHMLGKHDVHDAMQRYVNPRMFKFHADMRERVCESRDFAGGVIGQNLALEGLALGFSEPDKRAFVEDTVALLSGEMMEIFAENADNMARLGVDPTPAMDRVRAYHEMHLRKLGLDGDVVLAKERALTA